MRIWLFWLRVWIGGRLLWARWRNFGLLELRRISWVEEELLASRTVSWLVSWLVSCLVRRFLHMDWVTRKCLSKYFDWFFWNESFVCWHFILYCTWQVTCICAHVSVKVLGYFKCHVWFLNCRFVSVCQRHNVKCWRPDFCLVFKLRRNTWTRYRPGVAQRVGRGIALLFHDSGTRRGEWSAARPGRTLPPGKTRYPFYRRLGGPQGRSGRAENPVPTGIRSRTVQPVAQSLYRLSYRAHT